MNGYLTLKPINDHTKTPPVRAALFCLRLFRYFTVRVAALDVTLPTAFFTSHLYL